MSPGREIQENSQIQPVRLQLFVTHTIEYSTAQQIPRPYCNISYRLHHRRLLFSSQSTSQSRIYFRPLCSHPSAVKWRSAYLQDFSAMPETYKSPNPPHIAQHNDKTHISPMIPSTSGPLQNAPLPHHRLLLNHGLSHYSQSGSESVGPTTRECHVPAVPTQLGSPLATTGKKT